MILFQKITVKIALALIPLILTSNPVAQELEARGGTLLQKVIKEKGLQKNQLGYALYDIKNKKFLDTAHSKTEFTPASLNKILSIYFALRVLEPTKRYQTTLSYDGQIQKGILKGNLYLEGSGDPMLISGDLINFMYALRDKGITKVEGNFYIVSNNFPEIQRLSEFGLDDQTYNPGIGSLNIDFNRFQIRRVNSKYTAKADFEIIPPVDSLQIVKDYKAFTPGRAFRYEGLKEGKETWSVTTLKNYSYLEEIPIRHPSLFSANVFKTVARFHGLDLKTPVITNKRGLKTIYIHKGQTHLELSKLAMEYSNNLITESLMIKAAQSINKKVNSIEQAAIEMKGWYEKNLKELDWKQVRLANGSGLSVTNHLTPEFLTKFIAHTAKTKFSDSYFHSLLSLSGHNGWIRKRFNSKDTSYRVWAKTGSLDYVNNIAGVLTTNTGKNLSYTIFINDFKKRKILESENNDYVNSIRLDSKKWNNQTDEVIDALLEQWSHY